MLMLGTVSLTYLCGFFCANPRGKSRLSFPFALVRGYNLVLLSASLSGVPIEKQPRVVRARWSSGVTPLVVTIAFFVASLVC